MNQFIVRGSKSSNELEVYEEENGAIMSKVVNFDDFFREMASSYMRETQMDLNYMDHDDNVLFESIVGSTKKVLYRFDERKIKCTYSNKAYSIIHPRTIFCLSISKDKVMSIGAYCYISFHKGNTELYSYPFPNMLGQNKMCLGTVKIDSSNYLTAIMDSIEANYTHSVISFNRKGKPISTDAFFKMAKDSFPYDLLEPLNYTLETMLQRNTGED